MNMKISMHTSEILPILFDIVYDCIIVVVLSSVMFFIDKKKIIE